RHDPDDRERHALDRLRLSEDVGRAAESPLPQGVADDGDWTAGAAAAAVVVGSEEATDRRSKTQRVEVVAARVDAVHEIRRSAVGEVEARRPAREGEGRLEQIGMTIAD